MVASPHCISHVDGRGPKWTRRLSQPRNIGGRTEGQDPGLQAAALGGSFYQVASVYPSVTRVKSLDSLPGTLGKATVNSLPVKRFASATVKVCLVVSSPDQPRIYSFSPFHYSGHCT